MTTMAAVFPTRSGYGLVSLPDAPADRAIKQIIRTVSTKRCILPLNLYRTLPGNSPDADHQELPKALSGANMRDPDKALSHSAQRQTVPRLPTVSEVDLDSIKQESDREASGPDSELERTRRQALERRMPPRAGIQAIIDRRKARGLPDPWLDDKYDWKPKD
jgi:hypothetical protein